MKHNEKHKFQMQIDENWANDTAVIACIRQKKKKKRHEGRKS